MGTRYIGLFGAGAAALCLGSFTASIVWMYMTPAPTYITGQEPYVPTGRLSACDGPSKALSADEFDAHLDKSEARYGITDLRTQLAGHAVGHVLEVAVGTGRNLALYDWGRVTARSRAERTAQLVKKSRYGATKLDDVPELHSFTGVDVAADVLDVALRRVREVVPHGEDFVPAGPVSFTALATPAGSEDGKQQQQQQKAVGLLGGKIRLVQSDAQGALPRAPSPDGYYDTVVQTFGLCSVRDPWSVLAQMAAVARPGTGRIVLVEHGRGWWALVNGLLDRGARGHFDRFGCWWNRDLEAVVEQAVAADPALEVVELRRPGWFKFGTHYWIELRVRAPGEEGAAKAAPREPPTRENGGGSGGGGSSQAWPWLTLGSALTTKPKDGSDAEKKE
jgi:methyltransferase OMS1, mitochondrial